MSAHQPAVVILTPTYNEVENIVLMLEALDVVARELQGYRVRVLVVDDESPDGTGTLVTSYAESHPQVVLLSKTREGLGRAMIAGYEYAMSELEADVIVSLDCDFQWDPADIPRLLAELAEGADVAVGSRHLAGGRMEGWSLAWRCTHWAANTFFATLVAGTREVSDLNGNFRAIRVAGVLDRVPLRELPVRGYAFFNLMIYELSLVGAKFAEVPIIFRWRELGETKVSLTARYFRTFLRDTLEYIRLSLWIRRDRVLLGSRAIRRSVWPGDPPRRDSRATFLLVTLAVTFPTVWLSAGAKSRYYVPLYPLIAVLIAMILAHCATAARDTPAGRIWRRILSVTTVLILFLLALLLLSMVLTETPIASLRPPTAWAAVIVLSALAAATAALFARSTPGPRPAAAAVVLTATFLGLFHGGSVLSYLAERRQDAGPAVAALRSKVPRPEELVSFGPIHSRFRYFWGDLIPEIPWPLTLDDLPPGIDYFTFDLRPSDTPGTRIATRGMVVWTTPTTLPFEWREIGSVDCGRRPMNPPDAEVVVGQVSRNADGKPLPARVRTN